MNDSKPPRGDSPYRGPPSGPPRDKRERERDRRAHGVPAAAAPTRPPPRDRPAFERPAFDRAHAGEIDDTPKAPTEQRIYGLNACLALFAARPDAVRKVWLVESRIPKLKAVLAHCVKQRLGYTLVEAADLERLSGSAHHEGVVFGALPAAELPLSSWLRDLPRGPAVTIWLDGVGNPHNLGAILRSAAHFRVAGVLLPKDSTLALSGAAARVAEGGAEHVAMVRLGRSENAIEQLRSAGFVLASTVVRGGKSLYATALPARLVLLMGAEQTGVDAALTQVSALKLGIPGSGAVESLNVASATSVILGEWWRQHLASPSG
jgi:RNA methyltransferase, TrmH family